MNVTPKFFKSLLDSRDTTVNIQQWEKVLQLYKEGRYKDVIYGILDYVDPAIMQKRGNADKTVFNIPHGSAVVNIDITNDQLNIQVPFLRLPTDGGQIPLLRQVTQINFTPLDLAQIKLQEDLLTFHYECPIELAEPYKIYEVFREICTYADYYDDLFISDFGASWIQEPVTEKYDATTLDKVWNNVQFLLNESLKYVDYFERHRQPLLALDVMIITLKKIEYYVAPQGLLRSKIEATVRFMEQNIPPTDRLAKGKKFINELINFNRKDFDKDIYKIEVFVPYKYNSSMDNIKQNFEFSYKNAKTEIDRGDHVGACLSLQFAFFNLFYYNDVRDDLSHFVSEAMIKTSNMPWNEASKILYDTMDGVMKGNITKEQAKKKRSFWDTLFGRA